MERAGFFFAAGGALYLSFLALDLLSPGPLSTALKYAALLLCLLMALAGLPGAETAWWPPRWP